MIRALSAGLAALSLAPAAISAFAAPVDLMPEPLGGWTASGPVYGESVVEGSASSVPDKRIEISRLYQRGGTGLRMSLNTHDRRGAQLIAYVNRARTRDPGEAETLAAKGVVPFAHGEFVGVAMRTADKDAVSGAALRLGEIGTLTLEGIADGEPVPVALEDIRDYLKAADLQRMALFVDAANAGR